MDETANTGTASDATAPVGGLHETPAEANMRDSTGMSAASPASTTIASPNTTDAFERAGAEITELMRRFVEDVGRLRLDAQVAADAATASHADAERIRQEAMSIRKNAEADAERTRQEAISHRADAETEAIRMIDAARAEAETIRQEAEARAADAERVRRAVLDDIEDAQRSLAELLHRVGSDIGERTASEGAAPPDAWSERNEPA